VTEATDQPYLGPDMSQGCSQGYKPKTGPKMDPKEIHFETEGVQILHITKIVIIEI
jgi:hypothetical protein